MALGTLAVSAFLGPSLWANPLQEPDPVQRLLIEKGLLSDTPPPPPPLPPHRPARASPPGSMGEHQRKGGAAEMVITSMNFIDAPYQWGGSHQPTGFDCSGFTKYIFEQSLGITLPRTAHEQAHAPGLTTVADDDLKAGDLVFFNTQGRRFSHVGIYIGSGRFIHAPRTGTKVRIEDMRLGYWRQRFNGGRRAMSLPQLARSERPGLPLMTRPSSPWLTDDIYGGR